MSNCNFYLPAEWEPQWGVMLTWPHELTDWAPYLDDIVETMVAMTRAIARHEQVLIVIPYANDLPKEVKQMDNVHVFECPTNDTWARDHGPIILCPLGFAAFRANAGKETSSVRSALPLSERMRGMKHPPSARLCRFQSECGERNVLWLDFRFNGWGEKFISDWDNMIPMKLWAMSNFFNKVNYENHQDFVLEGGSIESDGRGTIFTTSQCLLAPHRNQPLTREEIENELKQRLHAQRIVWLDHGNLIGDDTDGHIDTIVRCAPDDTLLYVSCTNPADEQYDDFSALEQQLQQLHTTDGKPYRLLPLPMPETIYDDGERLPATYANFLVINGAVLVPTYNQPENDATAIAVIQQAFPNREMIPIDARTIIRQHGSVHCLTMQIPQIMSGR